MGKLGYSTLTLTDLTETLPISLVLESNLSQNVQTKTGQLYVPDLNKEGEELIITPSLFMGAKEIEEIPVKENDEQDSNYIYYQTGEVGEDGAEINYTDLSTKETGIWVDNKGRLHYKRNLNQNITIKAYINNFKNKEYSYAIKLVKAINPINILFLEEGDNNYNVVITSSGGREHFEEENAEPIRLTATLYHGITPIIDEVEYLWDVVTDSDDDPLKDWTKNTQSVKIERALVKSIEVFNCTIKNKITGLSYSSTKILRDFTDAYTNQLIADNTLILTPNNTSVKITNQVWYKTSIINNEEGIEEENSRFKYTWSLLTQRLEEKILITGKGESFKKYTIDLNAQEILYDENGNELKDENDNPKKEYIFPKENFSILGKVEIDGKITTFNYIDIKYQPVTYTIEISPKTIFVPATDNGIYRGEGNFTQEIKFQLLDDNKQPLIYDTNDAGPMSLINNNDGSSIEIERKDESIWDFDISFILDTTDSNNLWQSMNSKTYEFSYEYLGQTFYEEFEVVKNYAGIDGNPGEPGNPGYTVDLSNSFHAFAGSEGQADDDQEVIIKVKAFYGDEPKSIEQIIVPKVEGLTSEVNLTNGTITLTTGTGANALKEGGTLNLTIIIKNNSNSNFEISKTFSYIINYNGKSYSLSTGDINTITYFNSKGSYEPSNLTVTALVRETTGQSSEYTNGKIVYSYDQKTWYSYNNPIDFSSLMIDNVYLRLYSAQANLSLTDLKASAKYLLDEESIPVLVSLEGTQIGGENLLTWSRTFSEGRWYKGENSGISIDTEENFNLINFTNAAGNQGIFSAKIPLEKNYLNKTLCFSCLIYSDDWGGISNYLDIQLGGYEPDNTTRDRNCYGSIGTITSTSGTMLFEEKERKNGVWYKIYKTFILNDSFFTSTDSPSKASINNCVELDVLFYLFGSISSNIKIKKPKLEIGNIPTDWSLNYKDNEVLISDIEQQLSATNADLQTKITNLSNEQVSIGSEEPIFLSIISDISNQAIKNSDIGITPVTITKANGSSYTFLNLTEFKAYLEDLNKSNASQIQNYSTTLINNELGEYKSSIEIHPATVDSTEGYISLKTSTYTNNTQSYSEALRLTSKELSFWINGDKTAYMSNNKLFIPQGQVTDSLIIGRDRDNQDTDSHLKIFATEDSGIGFIWEEIQR